MALPALAAIGTWAASNPQISIPIGTSIASGIYRTLSPNRAAEIQAGVLNSQVQFRNTLAARALGRFTPADRQQMQEAAEPQLNQISANIARRGLGGSGAGQQVLAQAQLAPYLQAQAQAQQNLPVYDQQLLQSANALLMNDSSFIDDLTAIAALIGEEIKEPDETGVRRDPELLTWVRRLWEALGRPIAGNDFYDELSQMATEPEWT